MANTSKVREHIKDFLEKMKALDEAIPEELADDALEMVENVNDALCEDEDADVLEITRDEDIDEKEDIDIEKKIEDTMMKVLKKAGIVTDTSMSALDRLIKNMDMECEDAEEEESIEEVTVDPEKVNDSNTEMLKQLRKMKPIVASIKDSKVRRQMSDALVAFAKIQTGNNYSEIASIAKSASTAKMKDSKKTKNNDDFDLGSNWAKTFNPHYKEDK